MLEEIVNSKGGQTVKYDVATLIIFLIFIWGILRILRKK